MANWDFCDACNGGRHCCTHDKDCLCTGVRAISSYTEKELREEIKKRKLAKIEERIQKERERKAAIKRLQKELRQLVKK